MANSPVEKPAFSFNRIHLHTQGSSWYDDFIDIQGGFTMELIIKDGVKPTAEQEREIHECITKKPAEGWGYDNDKGCRELMQYVELEGEHGTYLYNVCVPHETITNRKIKPNA